MVARTVFGESRGESAIGKVAVASVIRNRARNPRWWGTNLREVCLSPFQFSVWNRHDENYVETVSVPASNHRFKETVDLVSAVMRGAAKDPTNNCDHYCRTDVAYRTFWAKDLTPVVIIGNHSFYRLELEPHEPDESCFGHDRFFYNAYDGQSYEA